MQPDTQIITKVEGGYATITYAEHRQQVSLVASAFAKIGLGEGDVLTSYCWNTAQHYQLYHAIPSMGAILNTLNIKLSEKESAWILNDAGTRFLVVDEDQIPKLEAVFKQFPELVQAVERTIVCGVDSAPWRKTTALPNAVDWFDFLATGDVSDFQEWPVFHEDSACFLCYTSGTTGNPKGVAYSHRSTYIHVISQGLPDQMNISGSDSILSVVPMYHAGGWCVPLACLMLGCRIVLVNRFMAPAQVADAIIDTGVTLSAGVPTVWQMLQQALEQDPSKIVRVRGVLKTLICGGTAPPLAMMEWFLRETGVEFRQVWGMTETNPIGTMSHFVQTQRDLKKTPAERLAKLDFQGTPAVTVQIAIADSDKLEETQPSLKHVAHDGESPGELICRGPHVTVGYWKGAGADKFIDGWLKTGDVSSLSPTLEMKIRDRSKDMVKSGGEFISSVDLENSIVGMPSVASACVVAVAHPKFDERPVVVVVLAPGVQGVTREEVHAFLAKDGRFTKWQWPDDVIVWDAIPMTGTGKIDKKAVRSTLKDRGYVSPNLWSDKPAEPVSKL